MALREPPPPPSLSGGAMFNMFKKKDVAVPFDGFSVSGPEDAEFWDRIEYTPDVYIIEQYVRQFLFVPDDLMVGGANHKLVEDAVIGPVLNGCYTSDRFSFWMKNLGELSYPIALPEGFTPDGRTTVPVVAAPIKGQVLPIKPSRLIVLDKYRQNGVQFTRRRVNIRFAYRQVRHKPDRPIPSVHDCFTTFPAWMYIGEPEYWNPMIAGIFGGQMDLHRHDTPRVYMDEFYKFEV